MQKYMTAKMQLLVSFRYSHILWLRMYYSFRICVPVFSFSDHRPRFGNKFRTTIQNDGSRDELQRKLNAHHLVVNFTEMCSRNDIFLPLSLMPDD